MPEKKKLGHKTKYKKKGNKGEIEITQIYEVDLSEYDKEIAGCEKILSKVMKEKTKPDQETLDFWNANVSVMNKKRMFVISQKSGLETEKEKFENGANYKLL